MKFEEILKDIDDNQQKIAGHGAFNQELLNKVNYKLRLDWNYYSNRMEGGTLTREETRSVMVGNIDVSGKPLKDVMEMNGHNKMVLEVLKMSSGTIRVSEKRMKEIHAAIMYEEDDSKRSEIGNWKSFANEIINYQDEKIDFALPSEVPEKIHSLLDNINAYLDAYFTGKAKEHPIAKIAQFHIDFLTIHPFYDGNGRTARVLTNILLMACKYPIIIIKEEHKTNYYRLLADVQVYGGAPDLFYTFLGERIIDTQTILLNVIDGKSIDEPDDLDKKILLLTKELDVLDPNDEVKIHLNKNSFYDIYNTWITDLLSKSIPAVQKFNHFFSGTNHQISIGNGVANVQFTNQPFFEVISNLQASLIEGMDRVGEYEINLSLNTFYGTLIKGGLNSFGCNYSFQIKFFNIKYEVWVDQFVTGDKRDSTKLLERLLHKPLSEIEMQAVVNMLTNSIYDHIDFHTKKNGLR
jgi:Fic family protein